mgnify:CR=1 FL=1
MFSAYFALEGFLASMEVLVFDSMSTNSKSFLTNLAFVLGGTFMSFNVHFDVVLGSIPIVTKMTRILIVGVVYNRM